MMFLMPPLLSLICHTAPLRQRYFDAAAFAALPLLLYYYAITLILR